MLIIISLATEFLRGIPSLTPHSSEQGKGCFPVQQKGEGLWSHQEGKKLWSSEVGDLHTIDLQDITVITYRTHNYKPTGQLATAVLNYLRTYEAIAQL